MFYVITTGVKIKHIYKTKEYVSIIEKIHLLIILTDVIYDKQDTQFTNKRNTEARSITHCYRVKAISIIYSECVFGD
jgi:hypothetical protein